MPNLPVNIDTSYADDAADASRKIHQQHHDELHGYVNAHDGAADPHSVAGYLDEVAHDVLDHTGLPGVGAGFGAWFFNVTDYGAAGDGSTDDSTAIQDALDAAALVATEAAPAVVYVPAVETHYVVSSSLSVPANVRFEGHPFYRTKLFRASSTTQANFILVQSVANVRVAHLHLESVNDKARVGVAGQGSNLLGVHASATASLELEHLKLVNLEYGLKIDGGVSANTDLRVIDLETYQSWQAVYISTTAGGYLKNLYLDRTGNPVESISHHLYFSWSATDIDIYDITCVGGYSWAIQSWDTGSGGVARINIDGVRLVDVLGGIAVGENANDVSVKNITGTVSGVLFGFPNDNGTASGLNLKRITISDFDVSLVARSSEYGGTAYGDTVISTSGTASRVSEDITLKDGIVRGGFSSTDWEYPVTLTYTKNLLLDNVAFVGGALVTGQYFVYLASTVVSAYIKNCLCSFKNAGVVANGIRTSAASLRVDGSTFINEDGTNTPAVIAQSAGICTVYPNNVAVGFGAKTGTITNGTFL